MVVATYNNINVNSGNNVPYQNVLNNQTFIYSSPNSYRMRAYHRLDIAFNLTKPKKHGTSIWSFSIYNVYNRQNPYFYYLQYDSNQNKYRLFQQSLFPIIPSFGYSYKF